MFEGRSAWIRAALVGAVFCAGAGTALAQAGDEMSQTQETATYKITLTIGPAATMLMPDQAAAAKQGEVMVDMPGMAMPSMSMNDQGHDVNHHLEAQIVTKADGKVVSDMLPTIKITDQAGKTRALGDVALMYDVQKNKDDMHFGNNIYLADGTYTISVALGNETATFKHVIVSGGAQMAAGASAPTPSQMPMTSDGGTSAPLGLAVLGGLLVCAGLAARRRWIAAS